MSATLTPESWACHYRLGMMRFAQQRLGNQAVAEDVVQEALLAAWQARSGFRGDCTEKTWLYGILRHKVLDELRRFSRSSNAWSGETEEPAPGAAGSELPTPWQSAPLGWGDPFEALSAEQLGQALYACLADMPERSSRAWTMRVVRGESTHTACKELGVTESNFWQLVSRARRRLRRCVQDQNSVDADATQDAVPVKPKTSSGCVDPLPVASDIAPVAVG